MIYPFLAIIEPVDADVLIVEGWIPERAYAQVAGLSRRGHYRRVLIVIPVYEGDELYDGPGLFYDDYILSVAVKQGVPAASTHVLLCPATRRDRTFHCARVARRWLAEAEPAVSSIDVATLGPHARRSRLLYRMAFGRLPVGAIALAEQTYDAERWWNHSSGIRDVFSETLGYLYARVLFRAPTPPHDDAPFVIPERNARPPR